MHLIVCGVRHKSASIEVRERFSFTDSQVQQAIPFLMGLPGIQECSILTTCNRTEVYVAVSQTDLGLQSLKTFFADFKGVDFQHYRAYIFTLLQEDAINHLFRVASGLDSLILGEGQILSQVKETLSVAQRFKSNGLVLDKLFKAALTVGKRVRTETGISSRDASVSRAAYEFAKTVDPDFLNRNISLVGGGKMIEILLGALQRSMTPEQQGRVRLVNRSVHRLESLSQKFGFQGVPWEQLPDVLPQTEVLFVATGAPHIILGLQDFQTHAPRLIIDISVPRNVDPEVDTLPGVQLFNTDDLEGISGFSPETKQFLLDQAQRIIEEEYMAFHQWFVGLPVVGPTITLLRSKIESIRKTEAACACPVTGTSCTVIDDLSKNLVNKILHDPTVRLKATRNLEEIYRQAAALSHLFNLEAPPEAPSQEPTEEEPLLIQAGV